MYIPVYIPVYIHTSGILLYKGHKKLIAISVFIVYY